jgi:TolB-like protein/DNA-binding winged helix-turn-helix (wHTH) protein/tetratricopeptide (TPR) repeat protein
MDKRVIRFDGWVVDFESGEISKNGTTTRLQDQPLQVLDELTQRPGEVVTREHLISRLWPKGVVEFDTGLNSAIRKLRIALGDGADTPHYIETLPRKGYRFVATLEPEPTAVIQTRMADLPYRPTETETGLVIGRRASDRRAPLKRLAIGFSSILAAIVLAAIAWHMPGKLFEADAPVNKLPTIVVLPLVDMSIDQKEQALCDGLTDELSNWLAHVPTLRVVARTSAFAFKGKSKDVREIAKALDATHVLEGSLRRSGDQLRVTVQLIEASSGLHIWSDSFVMPIGDIFLIEDTVSRSVAEALHLQLAADTAEVWAQRQPQKMEAYELYLLGRARQRERTTEDNLKSIEYFRRAIDADPDFALALTGLSESLLNGLSLNNMAIEEVAIEVEPLVNRALTLKPALADALAVKGWLLSEQFRFDEALPLLQQATRTNPNDAVSHRILGDLYDRSADPRKALEHFSTSARLDPLDFLSQVYRCIEYTDLGEYAEATRACSRARELDPTNMWGPLATAWIDRAQGRTVEAIQWIDAARKLSPGDRTLADQKVDLLLSLDKIAEARAAAADAPDDGSFESLSLDAVLVYAEGGAQALRNWLATKSMADKAATSSELRYLAKLQWMAQDAVAARITLAHADRVLPPKLIDKVDGGQIRHASSSALDRAGVEIEGKGDADKARKLLGEVDQMLATYEQNGGRHYGLYSLRAESFALQGRKKEAQAAIDEAWKLGWRHAWMLRDRPYFAGITVPGAKR